MVKLRLAERGAQHSTQAQRWPGHASLLFFSVVLNRAAGKKRIIQMYLPVWQHVGISTLAKVFDMLQACA